MATEAAGQRAADLALALSLADAADALTTSRFRAADLVVETKPDTTPVTDADRAVERLLRERVAEHHPADAFLGEEYGAARGAGDERGGRRWVVDPIDGTKNYARGVPVWATLIALQENGIGTVGVVSAPALGRRWWAATGHGAWLAEGGGAPRRLAVSRVGTLADASLSYSSLGGWGEGFFALADAVWRTRAFGDFWSYMLVAEGAVDLAAEPEVTLWDLAALDVVVREAGGTFTGLDGRPGPAGGDALASNGLLHASALRLLTG